jgi:hypothetical protein
MPVAGVVSHRRHPRQSALGLAERYNALVQFIPYRLHVSEKVLAPPSTTLKPFMEFSPDGVT